MLEWFLDTRRLLKNQGVPHHLRAPSSKIISLIYDMTKVNMRAELLTAAKVFKGLKFLGIYADCWTSRAGKGFLCIDITFIF